MACVSLAPTALAAQVPGSHGGGDVSAADLVQQADAAHRGFRPLDALNLLDVLLADHPESYAGLWRAAREAVSLGMLAQDAEERKTWTARAVLYARGAREAAPDGVEGASWLAVALGRQALGEGPRGKVRLAVEIRDVAMEALRLDSLSAAAHHVLGEWHAEIRRISGVERWMARKLLGGAVFETASWDAAVYHLERAAQLDPSGLIHHLDLARTYLDRGRKRDAQKALQGLLGRPSLEPVDPRHKQAAAGLLLDLGSAG